MFKSDGTDYASGLLAESRKGCKYSEVYEWVIPELTLAREKFCSVLLWVARIMLLKIYKLILSECLGQP